MAERRMFAKTIIDSDAFLDMPVSSQALYFHLSMRADDDGFINNPKKIQKIIGASEDDLKLLIAKNFIIPFESGIVVIKHWRIHNYIRNDRKHDTKYEEELSLLDVKKNGAYTLCQTNDVQLTDKCQTVDGQVVDSWYTEVRLGKDSIGKDSIGEDNTICSESNELTHEPPVISLILNDKTEYGITQSKIDEYKELYPAVDIMQELRKMKGWSINNPTKRKTKRGINRFINSWLSKEQDKGGYINQTDKKTRIDEWSEA